MGLQAIDETTHEVPNDQREEERFADKYYNAECSFSGRQICSTISKYTITIFAYLPGILRNLGEIVRELRFFDDEETVLIRFN